MKTHKELFNEFCTMTDDMLVCYEDNVINILAEHDKEWGEKIKDLLKQQSIEAKIEVLQKLRRQFNPYQMLSEVSNERSKLHASIMLEIETMLLPLQSELNQLKEGVAK